jgi:hypothetical protein
VNVRTATDDAPRRRKAKQNNGLSATRETHAATEADQPSSAATCISSARPSTYRGHPARHRASRRAVGWIMTDPANIDPADQRRLDAILAASPHLTAPAGHVRAFASIMSSLRGHDLVRRFSRRSVEHKFELSPRLSTGVDRPAGARVTAQALRQRM